MSLRFVDEDKDPAECIGPDCHQSFLAHFVVHDRNGHGIVKHRLGIREVDAVLPQIAFSLVRIPFERHRRIICTAVHTDKLADPGLTASTTRQHASKPLPGPPSPGDVPVRNPGCGSPQLLS